MAFDLEDVVGVALADVLRRAGLVFGCLLGAPFVTAFSFAAVEAIDDLSLNWFWDSVWGGTLWMMIMPVTSMWGVLYIPAVLTAIFYLSRAEAVTAKNFVGLIGLLCLLILLAGGEFDGEVLGAAVIIAGLLGSLLWFARWWDNKRAVDAEEHLIGVTIENEHRRHQMRDAFGTDVADGDFAKDEKPPSGEA